MYHINDISFKISPAQEMDLFMLERCLKSGLFS